MLQYEIWLHELKGISNRDKRALLEQFGSASQVYSAHRLDLPDHISHKLPHTKVDKERGLAEAERLLLEHEKLGINALSIHDSRYRDVAKHFAAAPMLLYYLGSLPLPSTSVVAVVGTRKATSYGIRATEYLCRQYHEMGWAIASGIAAGIEASAHRFAMEQSAATIGFAAHGLDHCLSYGNRKLTKLILDGGGAILSPFSLRTPALKHNYVQRNELLCFWSDEIVMVEGDEASGAVAIGRMGIQYGKRVLAVPNQIFSQNSAGCHLLLKEGAAPFLLDRKLRAEYTKNAKAFNAASMSQIGRQLSALLQGQPQSLEEFTFKLKIDSDSVQSELILLELDGLVRFQQDGKWHYIGW